MMNAANVHSADMRHVARRLRFCAAKNVSGLSGPKFRVVGGFQGSHEGLRLAPGVKPGQLSLSRRKCALRDRVLGALFDMRIGFHADFIAIHPLAISDRDGTPRNRPSSNSATVVYADA